MAVIILPDAQADLLSLQNYMLDKWGLPDATRKTLVESMRQYTDKGENYERSST